MKNSKGKYQLLIDKFFLQLDEISPEEINYKIVLDHFRNYSITITIIFTGTYTIIRSLNNLVSTFDYVPLIFGYYLFFCGAILHGLNFIQLIWMICKKSSYKTLLLFLCTLLFISTLNLTQILVNEYIK